MSESLDEASIGKQVLADRYELGELINQGGMAEVRRAHDRLLDRPVAVKIFRRSDDPAAQRRFDDEARALARLAHPGLVAIFDVGTGDDRPFLVMECVEGTSMRSRLLAGPWPLDQGLRIGGVLADALAHAHDRGVVHRAVQPSNILLDREDLPHLIDFGIAVLAGSPPFAGRNESLPATAYPAPEQWSDDQTGPPADVYALGSALLECLSGRAEQLPAGLPPEVADLLNAMTSTEILDRPTAQACASRLLAAVDDTPAARGVAELGQRRSNAHGGPPSLVVPDLISSRRSETCSITGGRGSVHPPASDLVRARRGPTGMIEDAFGLPPQLVTGHSRLSSSLGSGPSNWVRPATIMPLSRTDGQLRTPLNR